MNTCGRRACDGNGTEWACELPAGHGGDHRATWIDRDGARQLGIMWGWEKDGHAVWPDTPNAQRVTTERGTA